MNTYKTITLEGETYELVKVAMKEGLVNDDKNVPFYALKPVQAKEEKHDYFVAVESTDRLPQYQSIDFLKLTLPQAQALSEAVKALP